MRIDDISVVVHACTAVLPLGLADDELYDEKRRTRGSFQSSTPFALTENEAVMRVMQLLSHTGNDPAIPTDEVNAVMVALVIGGILQDHISFSPSGQTTFLTETLHAAGITASIAAHLLSSGDSVPCLNIWRQSCLRSSSLSSPACNCRQTLLGLWWSLKSSR
jgi:hypothetical protein